MTEQEIQSLVARMVLPALGKTYLTDVRTSKPARRVAHGRSNVTVRFPSTKMGGTIQAESRTVELPWLYQWEQDAEVLEFWDQPTPMQLSYQNANGKNLSFDVTFDYLLIRKNKIQLIECKSEEDMQTLAIKDSVRWKRDAQGNWTSPPAEAQAKLRGFEFLILTPRQISPVLYQNLIYLSDYILAGSHEAHNAENQLVLRRIEVTPGITMGALLGGNGDVSVDVVLAMIARKQIHVDLSSANLREPDLVHLYCHRAQMLSFKHIGCQPADHGAATPTLTIGSVIRCGTRRFTVLQIVGEKVTMQSDEGDLQQIDYTAVKKLILNGEMQTEGGPMLMENNQATVTDKLLKVSPAHLEIALRKFEVLQAVKNKKSSDLTRTERRDKDNFKKAEVHLGNGFLGLIPKYDNSGRRRKLVASVEAFLEKNFDATYATPKNIDEAGFVRILTANAATEGVRLPSPKTIRKWLKGKLDWKAQMIREGKRSAYGSKPFSPVSEGFAPNGLYPFHRCHIDHTLVDAQTVLELRRGNVHSTDRPWLTILYDDYTCRILAMVLLYDPPSYRSCMLVLRKCVERYGRLPNTVIVDNGKEFDSLYFEQLLAMYQVIKEQRPPAEPRFGSAGERLFGTCNQLFFHQLLGNTKLMTKVRQVTQGINPENLAVWGFHELQTALDEFAYEVYDKRPSSKDGISPRVAFENGVKEHGFRECRKIAYDETFRLLTMPTTRTPKATVQRSRGIKRFGMYYNCPELLDPKWAGTEVLVRYDPFDLSSVYVFCNKKWQRCSCRLSADLANMSERHFKLASQLFREQLKTARFAQARYEIELGKFLNNCTHHELDAQARRDALQHGGKAIAMAQAPAAKLHQSPAPPALVGVSAVVSEGPVAKHPDEEEPYGDF